MTTDDSENSGSETSKKSTKTSGETIPPSIPDDDDHGENGNDLESSSRWNVSISLDHFALCANENGEFLQIRNTEEYTNEEASTLLANILAQHQESGMYGWLQYVITEKEYGTLVVITDKSADQSLLNHLFVITVIIGLLMLLCLFLILYKASEWMTNPIQNALDRQKQFISDAGHELKTPLTILATNADLLSDEIGENKWLSYMQEQTVRMQQLVGDLLVLARMDGDSMVPVFSQFSLSTAVAATALPFESQAYEKKRNLTLDIQPGITYYGDEAKIRQLTAIFIENAIKYSDEDGIIKVTLLERGDQRVLEFYNTGCGLAPHEHTKIFERFYRSDKARESRGTNGYGLGLSIAKSIMDMHDITINITSEQGEWVRFLLIL